MEDSFYETQNRMANWRRSGDSGADRPGVWDLAYSRSGAAGVRNAWFGHQDGVVARRYRPPGLSLSIGGSWGDAAAALVGGQRRISVGDESGGGERCDLRGAHERRRF